MNDREKLVRDAAQMWPTISGYVNDRNHTTPKAPSSPATAIALLVRTFEEIKCGARTLDPALEIENVLIEHGFHLTSGAATTSNIASTDEARSIVTDWLGMFDPPPQIDFQQSELLQQAIASALHGVAQAGQEPETERLRDALGQIAGKNDLSGIATADLESAARNALYECELIAREALSSISSTEDK